MVIRGNSMWPFLRHGQEITVRKLKENESCRIGDIVVIKIRNFFLIHRVLLRKKTKDGGGYEYFTKGDRRLVGDGWIKNKNIVGRIPTGKTQRVFGYLAACYSFALLLIGEIINRRNA